MHWVDSTDRNKLIVKSYPLVLVSIVIIIMLMGTIGLIVQDHDMGVMDLVIFYSICLGFCSFHKYKKTTFDNDFKECAIYMRNVFKESDSKVALDAIKKLEMVHGGGGNYARGGVLSLVTENENHHIIDSDMQPRHEQKTIQVQQQIEAFIGR